MGPDKLSALHAPNKSAQVAYKTAAATLKEGALDLGAIPEYLPRGKWKPKHYL